MKTKQETFLDQVRRAVDESGLGRNELARRLGIDKATMSKFMSHERGIGSETLDRLAVVLGLRVVCDRDGADGPAGPPGLEPVKQKTPHVAPQGTRARQGGSGVARGGRRGGKAARATKGRA